MKVLILETSLQPSHSRIRDTDHDAELGKREFCVIREGRPASSPPRLNLSDATVLLLEVIQQIELHRHDVVTERAGVQDPAALLAHMPVQRHPRPVGLLALATRVET